MVIDLCSVCHKPATGSMNVTASCAGSVPSVFERRCDEHNPYRLNQHQPAAVAPRLSEDELNGIIENLAINCALNEQDGVDLLRELDATRADLARTRAEAAALRTALEPFAYPRVLAVNGFVLRVENRFEWLAQARDLLAAPQSEQPPAVPVDRSAEAKLAADLRQMIVDSAAACTITGCGHCKWLGWNLGRYESLAATRPPDHQAAGDSDG